MTAALKRLVCDTIQFVMSPPYEPPVTPRRLVSIQGIATEHLVEADHDVGVVLAAPFVGDGALELAAVAGGAAGVAEKTAQPRAAYTWNS